jgi:hypothetical protein
VLSIVPAVVEIQTVAELGRAGSDFFFDGSVVGKVEIAAVNLRIVADIESAVVRDARTAGMT